MKTGKEVTGFAPIAKTIFVRFYSTHSIFVIQWSCVPDCQSATVVHTFSLAHKYKSVGINKRVQYIFF